MIFCSLRVADVGRPVGLLALTLCVTFFAPVQPAPVRGQDAPGTVTAPSDEATPPGKAAGTDVLGGLNQLPGLAPGLGDEPATFGAEYRYDAESKRGVVTVRVVLAPGWHIYSTTQPAGGPLPTKIGLAENSSVRLLGGFLPDHVPETKTSDIYDVKEESFSDFVQWSAPFEAVRDFVPDKTSIVVELQGQVCKESCQPVSETLQAKYVGKYTAPPASREIVLSDGHVTFRGDISPAKGTRGWELKITATPATPYHIYAAGLYKPGDASFPTTFRLVLPKGWSVGLATASRTPLKKKFFDDGPFLYYYEKEVTWSIEILPPENGSVNRGIVQGLLAFQVCSESGCDQRSAAPFQVEVGPSTSFSWIAPTKAWDAKPLAVWNGSSGNVDFGPVDADDPATSGVASPDAFSLDDLDPQDESEKQSYGMILALAALGGFLLNFMPCVLPVIGLKVMAFVHQAGASRERVFLLNLFYSLGLISVFLVLATLLVAFDLGWGQQSQFFAYQVSVTAIIFVMGLSFLGVWEIPLPGFVGTSKLAQYSEQHEGYSAAFAKGIFTTLVAIPCTAPALATALAWCSDKPASVVYPVFLAMGLGMSFPYLMIGIQPRLVGFLPKPGMWMETFKEFLGFLLLATVIWFLWQMNFEHVVPTVAFLFGLWMACWLLGKIPITAPPRFKWAMRGLAVVVAAGTGIFSFGWFSGAVDNKFERTLAARAVEQGRPSSTLSRSGQIHDVSLESESVELPWAPFSNRTLKDEIAKGNTVLVDFTADW